MSDGGRGVGGGIGIQVIFEGNSSAACRRKTNTIYVFTQ